MRDQYCVFCNIIAGEIPAPIVARNEHAVAFADRSPQAPVHLLVVPTQHIVSYNHLPAQWHDTIIGMTALITQLAQTHGNARDHGFNLKVNTGASAGQEVFHMHWHFLAGK